MEQTPQARQPEKAPLGGGHLDAAVTQISGLIKTGEVFDAFETFWTLHPADQSDVLFELNPEDQQILISNASQDLLTLLIGELNPRDAIDLTRLVSEARFAIALGDLAPDVAADILHALPDGESAEILSHIEDPSDIINLLSYPDDSAGGLMSPVPLVVRSETNAGSAVDALRIAVEEADRLNVVFVVDANARPVGYLGIKRIVLARTATPITELMRPLPATVVTDTDPEECLRLVERYDLAELAVINPSGRLVGVITANALAHVAVAEASEDMFRIAGMGTEGNSTSIRQSLRSRAPWLTLNLFTTLIAAAVIGLFESTIAQVAVLAIFLPVVAGQGGIGGTQTLTLVVRSMALGELGARRQRRIVWREAVLGLLNGVYLGILVGLVAGFWKGQLLIGIILGFAILGNMVVAGLVGAGVPVLLRRFGQDPAVSSAVVVTTVTDIIGFLLFLGFASLVIEHLG